MTSSVPWACRAAFLAGFLIPFNVNLVGAFPLGEFVLVAVTGLLIFRICIEQKLPDGPIQRRLFWFFLACQAVALSSYIISDLLRDSDPHDMIRGWSRMVFLAVDVAAFTYLYSEDQGAFVWSQVGAAIGGILSIYVNGALFDDIWKFGFAGPVTMMTLLFAPRLGVWAGIAAVAALGVLHFAMDFRSMGGVCFVIALLLALQRLPSQVRPLVLVPALLVGAAAVLAFSRATSSGSERGDRSTVERTAMMTAAWECLCESPLLGQGSWFSKSRMMDNFLALRSEAAQVAGVHGFAADAEEETLAIHSQLLVSVSEGGLFGGTFFFVFGAGLIWALLHTAVFREPDEKSAIYLLTLLLSLWNLFLSPFSGAHRIVIAMSCGLILALNWENTATGTDGTETTPIEPAELSRPIADLRS